MAWKSDGTVHQWRVREVAFVIQVVGIARVQALVVAHDALAQHVEAAEDGEQEDQAIQGEVAIDGQSLAQRSAEGVVFDLIGGCDHVSVTWTREADFTMSGECQRGSGVLTGCGWLARAGRAVAAAVESPAARACGVLASEINCGAAGICTVPSAPP